jgi:hypothetical protein
MRPISTVPTSASLHRKAVIRLTHEPRLLRNHGQGRGCFMIRWFARNFSFLWTTVLHNDGDAVVQRT